MESASVVEDLNWSKVHSLLFLAFSIGALIEAYVYSLSYIATGWVVMPRSLLAILALCPPLWLLIGGAVSGPLADKVGRKKTLFITLAIYSLGALGLIFSYTYITILIFIGLLLFASGGEYNTILTATHELFPRKYRSRALFLELNFTNIGGSIAAILALLAISSIVAQRELLGITLLVSILIMYIIRLRLPESVMWLESKGEFNSAKSQLEKYYNATPEKNTIVKPTKLPSLKFRIIIGGIIGWAYTAGFTLIVLTLGPYFFPSLTEWLIFIFGVVAFIAGFIGLLADKFNRKRFLLISAILVVIFAYLFIPTLKIWIIHTLVFWFLFIGVSVFINIYFLAEDTLKSEMWPTRRRGLYSASVRVISLGGSIPVIFLVVNLPIVYYMWVGIGIFASGLAAAVAWYIWGIDTGKGKSVRIWD